VTVDGTGTPEGLISALRLTAWGGRCTSIGQLAAEGTLPLLELYTRGSTCISAGPWRAAPLHTRPPGPLAAGRLRPHIVTSATLAWDDAPQALLEPATKLIFLRA
jgi:hypothetical protein